MKELIGTTAQKEQNRINLDQEVVEKSLPDQLIDVVENEDDLSSKISLGNILEFLCKCGNEDYELMSFNSYASSNIDKNITHLEESAIFVKLFSKQMRKDWPSRLEKIGRFAEEHNTKNPKRAVKLFVSSECTIIIGASCYYQSESTLLND